jgi:hypothetical protein
MVTSKKRSLIRKIGWSVAGCTIAVGLSISSVLPNTQHVNTALAANPSDGGKPMPTSSTGSRPNTRPLPPARPTPTLVPLHLNSLP